MDPVESYPYLHKSLRIIGLALLCAALLGVGLWGYGIKRQWDAGHEWFLDVYVGPINFSIYETNPSCKSISYYYPGSPGCADELVLGR